MKYTFTKHAIYRFRERSNDTIRNIINLLKRKKYIPIGQENTKKHYLIYSIVDDNYHVIICDTRNKEIITILPIDYHNNCAWNIDTNILKDVKELTVHGKISKNQPPTKYKLFGTYTSYDKPVHIGLGSMPINDKEVKDLVGTEEFWSHVYTKLEEKEIGSLENILIRKGKHKKTIATIPFKNRLSRLSKKE